MGEGTATLVAARILIEAEQRVLILNPGRDFFLTPTEFGFDERALGGPQPPSTDLEDLFQLLGPLFPGAIERSSTSKEQRGFVDTSAPFLRSRTCTWVSDNPWQPIGGLTPSEDLIALDKIPGVSLAKSPMRSGRVFGMGHSRFCDFDLQRYRGGVLEFLLDRPDWVTIATGIGGLEVQKSSRSLRYYYEGELSNSRAERGVLFFSSDTVYHWLLSSERNFSKKIPKVNATRLFEQWLLFSKDALPVDRVAILNGCLLLPQMEGNDHRDLKKLLLIRAEESEKSFGGVGLGESSFETLDQVFNHWLGWEYFTVRSVQVSSMRDWSNHEDLMLLEPDWAWFFTRSEGGLAEVIRNTKMRMEELLGV